MMNLYDEVRNGFYITTAIKQAWAAQLQVLFAIDKICEKHGIEYFTDWGTLMAAVRHGGYIPWDDDLDICMKREDYIKFRKVADEELPNEFAIHDYERQEDHWLFIAKVVNCNHISFEESHLQEYNNFPYIACVDIFIVDYMYKDPQKEIERSEKIKYLLAVAEGIVEKKLTGETKENSLQEIENKYNVIFDRNLDERHIGIEIYKLIETLMGSVPKEEANNIAQIFPWVLKGFDGYPKEYYEKSIKVPFEGGFIRVPAAYDEVLKKKYGAYLNVVKGVSAHGYPFFEGQKENLINSSKEIDALMSKFVFDKEMLNARNNLEKEDTFKDLVKECLNQILNIKELILNCIKNANYNAMRDHLADSQQLAIDLGNLIDQVRGDGNLCTEKLVVFCERVFNLYENPADDKLLKEYEESIEIARLTISEEILDKKVIVFLWTGDDSFAGMEKIYTDAYESNALVYVQEMDLYKKDIYGNLVKIKSLEESSSMSADFLALVHPDIIYTNYPYDDNNPCISIHPDFYAKNLIKYTDKLIFVQPWNMADFSTDSMCEMYNLKHYACSSAVVYADEILLGTKELKERYVEVLTDFAGNSTKKIWEEKIKVDDLFFDKSDADKNVAAENESNNKKILYCIGASELIERPEDMLKDVKSRMDIFAENCDKLSVDIKLFPEDISEWRKIDDSIASKLMSILDDISSKNNNIFIKDTSVLEKIEEYDAYYGSPSPAVLLFKEQKKPIMISAKN